MRRDFGAEGHEIGAQLAERLGIAFYDKDILGKAAYKKGIDEASFSQADESVTKTYVDPVFPSRGFTRKSDQLFALEKEFIRDVAATKSCVIVGRLSAYILRNNTNVFNILITAPFDFRVKNIQEKYHSSLSDAKKLVKHVDAMRRDYRNYYSNGKWQLYEKRGLMLNREVFDIPSCVEILETAVKVMKKQCLKEALRGFVWVGFLVRVNKSIKIS